MTGPEVSLIVPVHGRVDLTQRCLDAVLAIAEAGLRFEVIVVDDASPDHTREVLAGYGDRLRVVRHDSNRGFAEACNNGAAAGSGNLLLFLNNDTLPTEGWLDALLTAADEHPSTAVFGSKLLYPDGTVQHAGVVICQDRYPRHLYAGFPADHAAPSHSRPLQAVTGACMLVRQRAFREVGGFDAAYRNSYEDVDLCLRLRDAGHGVRYCAESVLYHLESSTRNRRAKDVEESLKVYRERWLDRVGPDDIKLYLEDGLIRLRYDDVYPFRLEVSPMLAALTGERESEADRLLTLRARQVSTLLRHVARLEGVPLAEILRDEPAADHAERTRLDDERLAAIGELDDAGGELMYPRLVRRIREVVQSTLPPQSTVLVASKGDEELLRLDGCSGWHFPQEVDGAYAGRHPADDGEAVAQLEELRTRGAEFLLLPQSTFWWLEHYRGLRDHLERRYRVVAEDDSCRIYALKG